MQNFKEALLAVVVSRHWGLVKGQRAQKVRMLRQRLLMG